ncbi:MAG: hypothetical protein GY839_05935 [candidate division Zixibacteria bacterium]|nr:hypothetical protein [candidate division Zixibacteria bacterium]
MKTKLFLAIFMMSLLCLPVMADYLTVTNGDFENWTGGSGGPPDNWTNDNNDFTSAQEASTVHGGTYSVNLTWTSQSNQDFVSDLIAVTAEELYTITAWEYDNDIAGRLRLCFEWYDADSVYLAASYSSTYSSDAAEWVEYTYAINANASAVYCKILIRQYDVSGDWDGNATVYVDDVTLFEGTGGANVPPDIGTLYRDPYPTVFPDDDVVVRTEITDIDGTIDDDSLYYQTTSALLVYTPVYHDSIVGDEYYYVIPAQAAGTLVEYYVIAVDDDAERTESYTTSYTVSDFPTSSLQNGGYELWTDNGAGGPPDDWSIDTDITAVQEGTEVHGGLYSANLTWTSPTQANCDFMSDAFTITAEESYVCSLWYYDNDIAGRLTLYYAWDTGNAYSGTYTTDAASWQLITFTSVAPVGATAVQVGIRGYDISGDWDGDCTVYVDDCSVNLVVGGPDEVDIYDVQYTTVADGDCYDSPYIGQNISVTGTVAGIFQGTYQNYYMQDCSTSDWNGLFVYDDNETIAIGDEVTVVGSVAEYHGGTQLSGISSTDINSSGNAICTTTVTSDDLSPACNLTTEAYEAVLVKLSDVLCVISTTDGKAWVKSDGATDSCAIDDYMYQYGGDQAQDLMAGNRYDIIGQVGVYDEYMLYPRFASDVTLLAGGPPIIANVAHHPDDPIYPTDNVSVSADITDDGTIDSDSLYVETVAAEFFPVTHDSIVGDTYWYTIGTNASGTTVNYYVVATDNEANRSESATDSYVVQDPSGCPDNIYDIQFTVVQGDSPDCFFSPDSGTTVDVCGVITGLKAAGTGDQQTKFFIQNPDGTTWEAIYIYDNLFECPEIAVGDLVEVFATVSEYEGLTELVAVTGITILDTNVDLPETTSVLVSDFDDDCSWTTEPYEGLLVKIENVTCLSEFGDYEDFWITDDVSSDSILISNYLYYSDPALAPAVPPATDVQYASVIGILRWEILDDVGGVWSIEPRFGDDFEVLVIPPPIVLAAYPGDQSSLCVLFDHDMDQASVENVGNYSIFSGLSITAAVQDPSNVRKVILSTAGQTDGLLDSVTVENVQDQGGETLVYQRVAFRQGFTPISQLQFSSGPGPDTTWPSDMMGEMVTVKGFITADSSSFNHNNWWISDNNTEFNGVLMYLNVSVAHTWLPELGDTIIVSGFVDEYYGETELHTGYDFQFDNMVLVSDQGSDPEPMYMGYTTAEHVYNNQLPLSEELEGVFCKLCDSLLVAADPNDTADPYDHFLVSLTTGDTLSLEGLGSHRTYTIPATGTTLTGLTGIHRWRYGIWRLVPRADDGFNTGVDCEAPEGYEYLPGDANMPNGIWPPSVIGADVTYLVNYFRGISVSCLLDGFYASGDANGDCMVIGSDVTKLVTYFRGLTSINNCADYPPLWPTPEDLPPSAPPGWPNCEGAPASIGSSPSGQTK